jgi:hypothetical protein
MNIHSEKPSTEVIKFETGKRELDDVLVARSAAGVCTNPIDDGTEVLKRDLAEEFTDAKLVRDDWALRSDLEKILTSDGRRPSSAPPTR